MFSASPAFAAIDTGAVESVGSNIWAANLSFTLFLLLRPLSVLPFVAILLEELKVLNLGILPEGGLAEVYSGRFPTTNTSRRYYDDFEYDQEMD